MPFNWRCELPFYVSSSYSTKTYNYPLTLNSVFSETNKSRVQEALSRLPTSYVPKEDVSRSRRSAVLIPLCIVNGQPSVLFTLRARHLSKHAGEVSFPGGMEDDTDGGNPIMTALREANEELAIPRDKVDVWGTLTEVPSRAKGNTKTVPILAFCDVNLSDLRVNPTEVDSFFYRTISSLIDPQNVAFTQFRSPFKRFDDGYKEKKASGLKGFSLPVYRALKDEPYEHKIWGLSAMILHQTLKVLLTKELYTFEVKFIS